MDFITEIRDALGEEWLSTIYESKVRSQRTRAYQLDIAERPNTAEILHTLLGIELKVGNKRFSSPDLSTARYLRVFARIGCRDFAVPYDITKISGIADELETSWQKTLILLEISTEGKSSRAASMAKGKLLSALRDELRAIGAGDAMPEFRQTTKQRNT